MSALIFIVEDDNDVAGLIKFNLEASGFQTRHFARGDAVLAEATATPPALFCWT